MSGSGFLKQRPGRRAFLAGTAVAAAGLAVPRAASADQGGKSGSPLWRHDDVALLLIDYQPQTFDGLDGPDPRVVELNARLLARAATALEVPVVLTEVGVAAGINDPTIPALLEDLPGIEAVDRSTMDSWEDDTFRQAVEATGRRKLAVGGLYSEICVAFPAVHALDDGYDVAFVSDAIAGRSVGAHESAMTRMTKAGATASSTVSMVLEWFLDWNSPEATEIMPILEWYDAELPKLAES
ncbi:MAG: isochorismatase family protein [Stackebrandtia sp.]